MYIDIPDKIFKRDGTLEENATYYKAVSNSLRNIIMTPIGSVPGNPLFGTNIMQYLFEPMGIMIAVLIEEEIKAAIDQWEPRVTIIKVNIIDNPEYNRISASVVYTIKNDLNEQEFTTSVNIKR